MMKQSFILSFKVILIITAYYVLNMYFEGIYILVGVVIVAVPIIVYNLKTKGSFEYILEVLCDPFKYLETIQTKYLKKDDTTQSIYLAYAYVYQGDYKNALVEINKINHEEIEENPKLNLIYYIVNLKLAYNDQDIEKYSSLYAEVKEIELDKDEKIEIEVFDAPLYMLEKRYVEAIELLKDLIPHQRKRYLVMELEYYLALAYIETKSREDAVAVLNFVSDERYHLIYNELARELLIKIRKPIESK